MVPPKQSLNLEQMQNKLDFHISNWSWIAGIVVMCFASSCAVFTPSETDFTINRSREAGHPQKTISVASKRVKIERPLPAHAEKQREQTKKTSRTEKASSVVHPKDDIEKSTPVSPSGERDKVHSSKKVSKAKKRVKRIRRDLTPEEVEERDEVVKNARKLKGAKYKYGGKGPFGFDCSGFVGYVFEKDEVYLPATAKSQSTIGRRISLDDVVEGDLLFFGEGKKVSHVAMVTSNDGKHIYIIHSTSGAGVIEEDLYQSQYWMERYLFARDVLGE